MSQPESEDVVPSPPTKSIGDEVELIGFLMNIMDKRIVDAIAIAKASGTPFDTELGLSVRNRSALLLALVEYALTSTDSALTHTNKRGDPHPLDELAEDLGIEGETRESFRVAFLEATLNTEAGQQILDDKIENHPLVRRATDISPEARRVAILIAAEEEVVRIQRLLED